MADLDWGALTFMWNGGETRRYHGFRMLQEDTVGHHSYNVACIVCACRPEASGELLRAVLRHDAAEHIVGDMPAPTKRAIPGLQKTFTDYERALMDQYNIPADMLTDDDKYILKMADAMDGMRFCVAERALGNQRIGHVFRAFSGYVKMLLDEAEARDSDYVPLDRPEAMLYALLWSEWKDANNER